ncbi:MAG: DUF371 domain-containing protein [Caldisphaera sp.]|nr:DUF371 domain-containing protein [Caldisphaera sp.]PMP61082.1 MAG: DUF371 domain-containing protein [Caldisphaera sp.]
MKAREISTKWYVFNAHGHKNIKATHKTTFEITKDEDLTPRGDCIIAVKSEKAAQDLPYWLINEIKNDNTLILAILCSKNICDSIIGYGSKNLLLNDKNKIIFRKSNYIEGSTIMIKSNKAAIDINRKLIEDLRNEQLLTVMITAMTFKGDKL